MNISRYAYKLKCAVMLLIIAVLLFCLASHFAGGSDALMADIKVNVLAVCDNFRHKYFGGTSDEYTAVLPANLSATPSESAAYSSSIVYCPEDDYAPLESVPAAALPVITPVNTGITLTSSAVPVFPPYVPAAESFDALPPLSLQVSGRLTSQYGYRLDPVTRAYTKFHKGIDFAGNTGDPVFPAACGTVLTAQYSDSYGNYVTVDHGGGLVTLYAHMSKLCAAPGDRVDTFSKLGEIGSTGNSTGPHLHFETIVDGENVDPASITDFRSYCADI